MRVKVRKIEDGLHPNEVIVEVRTSNGSERLVVDKRAIEANSLSVGAPLRQDGGLHLVELPRETTNGQWRVWVESNVLSPDKSVKVA
ncbi:MAG: hypothetical protein P4L57_00070 [Rhizomicrobium sp.]|nr:hypothetical protein [Rhizomicrobium sp.]